MHFFLKTLRPPVEVMELPSVSASGIWGLFFQCPRLVSAKGNGAISWDVSQLGRVVVSMFKLEMPGMLAHWAELST